MRKHRTFAADPGQIAVARRFVAECARMSAFPGRLDDLLIATSEACTNAVNHSGSPSFVVTWRSTDDTAEITVEDQGIFRALVSTPEIDGVAHRGLLLMAATMDEMSLQEGTPERPGTRIRLLKRAGSG